MCLPSDALLQHRPSCLGLSYLVRGVSLHGCSSKAQPLLLTLDKGYLLTAAILPELQCGIALLGPPAPELMVQGKEQQLCFAGAALKRFPTPKVRETQVRW